MSELPTNEPNCAQEDERPAFLGRIRPAARVAFGVVVLWQLAGFAEGLWVVVDDLYKSLVSAEI
jgi:hypothetical protein